MRRLARKIAATANLTLGQVGYNSPISAVSMLEVFCNNVSHFGSACRHAPKTAGNKVRFRGSGRALSLPAHSALPTTFDPFGPKGVTSRTFFGGGSHLGVKISLEVRREPKMEPTKPLQPHLRSTSWGDRVYEQANSARRPHQWNFCTPHNIIPYIDAITVFHSWGRVRRAGGLTLIHKPWTIHLSRWNSFCSRSLRAEPRKFVWLLDKVKLCKVGSGLNRVSSDSNSTSFFLIPLSALFILVFFLHKMN